MNNKTILYAVVALVVLVVVGYGGYRVYRHFKNAAAPAMAPETSTTVQPTTPTPPATTGNTVYQTTTSPTLGSYFSDLKGMTLYTFAKDTAGVSTCTGQCLVTWPAYVAPSATGNFPTGITVITRSDSTLQYAWKGMPLYYFSGDKAAGDTKGQGVGGVWSVAK